MGKTTRREFLKQVALTGAAVAGLPEALVAADEVVTGAGQKSRVVIATDKAVLRGSGDVEVDVLQRMLDRGMAKLTGSRTAQEAWKKLFKPSDVVGIKVNCLFGKGVSTRPEVAQAIVRGLISAGVKPDNIIIWDRSTSDLVKVGYKPNSGSGVKCYGDDGDWGPVLEHGAFKGRITKVISEKITALINVPILKTHGLTGISNALKNHYGSFDNPGSHHNNHCNPAMADFNSLPIVKKKTRLVVVDALRPQYDGGPGFKGDAQWDLWCLMLSTDPVAVDYQGLQIIQEQRAKVGLPAIKPEVTAWLQAAQERGVGTCDPSKIEVLRV
ncbi:MAG: DUF362 domain-containing protein [Armatimonadota bacterium]|nr:DUF362 domain-containing protein [Armatimonadota bacterium]